MFRIFNVRIGVKLGAVSGPGILPIGGCWPLRFTANASPAASGG